MYGENTNSELKNENTASVSHGGQQENVELITVINFIEQNMKTLSNYGEQSNPSGQEINLSKKRLTKETFKLLNKNLNFVATQTNFNKNTLNKELEDFYRRIKLKAHFKNPPKKAPFTDEDIFRKPTNKTCVPNNNHHCIEIFIEATRNEINNEIEKTK